MGDRSVTVEWMLTEGTIPDSNEQSKNSLADRQNSCGGGVTRRKRFARQS
jgi:hypothetical protein